MVSKTHVSFQAEVHHALGTGTVEVIPVSDSAGGVLMTICTLECPIYITKAQAMEFFNLVPKEHPHAHPSL